MTKNDIIKALISSGHQPMKCLKRMKKTQLEERLKLYLESREQPFVTVIPTLIIDGNVL